MKKHMFPMQIWEMKDGVPTKIKYEDKIFIRYDLIVLNNNKRMEYKKKPVEPSENSIQLYKDWLKDKYFFYPYDIMKKHPKQFTKGKVNGIIAKLLEEKKILQHKPNEFKVCNKEVIEA